MVMEEKRKWKRCSEHNSSAAYTQINNLDDGCLMHIFSFLSPIPESEHVKNEGAKFLRMECFSLSCYDDDDATKLVEESSGLFTLKYRYNTALVCQRWCFLACHPRLWLRVDRYLKDLSEPGVFPSIEAAVSAARPGDTILIAAGGTHIASNILIKKPLCLIGGGELPDDTTLTCSRGSDSALEFVSTCKLANLTVKAELGCCLLHRSGKLIIDRCILLCESDPLDFLSYAIVCMANGPEVFPPLVRGCGDGVFVSRTRIEGGAKAVSTSGTLATLQRVRVIYARTSVFFWFDVEHR